MKKVFSTFLVISNLFLSNSLLSLAEPTEKVTTKKVVTVDSEKKKVVKAPGFEEILKAMVKAQNIYASLGITTTSVLLPCSYFPAPSIVAFCAFTTTL